MEPLELFALVVLVVLILLVAAIWVLLALLPGVIARKNGHPQAEAINVCGWWGAITLGLLLPVAWIWAFTRPVIEHPVEDVSGATDPDDQDAMPEGESLT